MNTPTKQNLMVWMYNSRNVSVQKTLQKIVPGSHLEHLGGSGWICVDLGGYFKKCKPSKNIAKTSPRESFGASGWIWVDLDGSG